MENHGFMELEQRKAFLIKFCYWGVIALCIYMAVKFLLPVLFPFVAAYAIAYVLDKPARRMAGGSRWKRTVSSVLLSMAFFILAGGLAVWLGAGMLLGLKFAGFIGMLGVPFLLAFVKRLNDKGIVHLLR